MTLVYRLPGPSRIMSASPMAFRLSGRAAGRSGSSRTCLMRQSCSFLKALNLGLPHHGGAVLKGGLQLHVGVGHGQHPAGDGQDLAHPGHGLVEGPGDAVEGRPGSGCRKDWPARLPESLGKR